MLDTNNLSEDHMQPINSVQDALEFRVNGPNGESEMKLSLILRK